MQQLQFKKIQQIEQAPSNVVIDELEEETLRTVVELMARAMIAVVRGVEEEGVEEENDER